MYLFVQKVIFSPHYNANKNNNKIQMSSQKYKTWLINNKVHVSQLQFHNLFQLQRAKSQCCQHCFSSAGELQVKGDFIKLVAKYV